MMQLLCEEQHLSELISSTIEPFLNKTKIPTGCFKFDEDAAKYNIYDTIYLFSKDVLWRSPCFGYVYWEYYFKTLFICKRPYYK